MISLRGRDLGERLLGISSGPLRLPRLDPSHCVLCVPKTCATWVDASTGSLPRSAVSGTLLAMLA